MPQFREVSTATTGPGVLRIWLPPAVWAGLILFASSDLFSAHHTSMFIEPLLRWIFPHWNESQILHLHFLIRKCAHVTEYGILALLVYRSLLLPQHSPSMAVVRHLRILTVLLCACVATLDEFHQRFVPSRTSSPYDVLLDTFGAALFLTLLAVWRWWHGARTATAQQR